MVRPARTAKERAQREQHMQKPKATLQDLAYVLRLLLEGINQELVERIDAHLVSNPALAQDRRFASLYTGAKRAEIADFGLKNNTLTIILLLETRTLTVQVHQT
ncbi:hypothetical protein RhiXN_08223 [Rhizoctonia solani]|uniref:Uncharacterized protein n=1 Tax=Rhizoctonia solani TaxID=456999 RepID=A0A8H8T018_9AGAM|nr:uncharacterized protein RhiXN_08223 [Rhizoctonia solani]QRW23187.1 hypothetical protein RhiXN_08223 [Rhizoctonia solani]